MIMEQDGVIDLYVTFTDLFGEAATVSGTPVVSVFHRTTNGTTVEDFVNQDMTLLSGTTYCYKWQPTARAHKGSYAAKYQVDYSDDTIVVGEETFQIVDRKFYQRTGSGLIVRGKDFEKPVWTNEEKDTILKSIDKLKKLDSFESKLEILDKLDMLLDGKIKMLSKIDLQLAEDIQKQEKHLTEMHQTISKLYDKELPEYDDTRLVIKLSELRKELIDLKSQVKNTTELNRELRIPYIIGELDDIKLGIENFQKDIVKVFTVKELAIGVGINEKTK